MRLRLQKLLTLFLSVTLALSTVMPAAALAEERSVRLDNHTLATDQATTITNVRIDGVEAPEPGTKLDDTATVTTAEGATWDIATLWVRDDLDVSTMAEETHTYLPVLAFFVPQDYVLEGGDFTVTLSDSLTELFGTNDIISVYDDQLGITYILPATLRDLFEHSKTPDQLVQPGQHAPADVATTMPLSVDVSAFANELVPPPAAAPESVPTEAEPAPTKQSLVKIYCAQTARNVMSDEDLEWLIDLVLHYLQPQAVELLINKFPAFKEAASNNELGTSIGMYIYYLEGDQDGLPEHESAEEALAYVSGDVKELDGKLAYCYMIGIDVSSMTVNDAKNKPIADPVTGKFRLVRSGEDFETFQNTIVHEMFHAFMDDYNRAGMIGALSPEDVIRRYGDKASKDDQLLYERLHYPKWFIEGTASTVENVYDFQHVCFELLRMKDGKMLDVLDGPTLVDNYLNGLTPSGTYAFFPLDYAAGGIVQTDAGVMEVTPLVARYVSGYLATLYLSELAYQKVSGGDSVKSVDANNKVVFSADKLRTGLSSILTWMHDGQALDKVIKNISANKNGVSTYVSTSDFSAKFISGEASEQNGVATRVGDPQSVEFVVDFLNYMTAVEKNLPNGAKANGSILFDFDKNYSTPLDPSQKTSSSFYQIIESNALTPSTVTPDKTAIGAGKSAVDSNGRAKKVQEQTDPAAEAEDDALSRAAKAKKKGAAAVAAPKESAALATKAKREAAGPAEPEAAKPTERAGADVADSTESDESSATEPAEPTESAVVDSAEPAPAEPAATEPAAPVEEPTREEQTSGAVEPAAVEEPAATNAPAAPDELAALDASPTPEYPAGQAC